MSNFVQRIGNGRSTTQNDVGLAPLLNENSEVWAQARELRNIYSPQIQAASIFGGNYSNNVMNAMRADAAMRIMGMTDEMAATASSLDVSKLKSYKDILEGLGSSIFEEKTAAKDEEKTVVDKKVDKVVDKNIDKKADGKVDGKIKLTPSSKEAIEAKTQVEKAQTKLETVNSEKIEKSKQEYVAGYKMPEYIIKKPLTEEERTKFEQDKQAIKDAKKELYKNATAGSKLGILKEQYEKACKDVNEKTKGGDPHGVYNGRKKMLEAQINRVLDGTEEKELKAELAKKEAKLEKVNAKIKAKQEKEAAILNAKRGEFEEEVKAKDIKVSLLFNNPDKLQKEINDLKTQIDSLY